MSDLPALQQRVHKLYTHPPYYIRHDHPPLKLATGVSIVASLVYTLETMTREPKIQRAQARPTRIAIIRATATVLTL